MQRPLLAGAVILVLGLQAQAAEASTITFGLETVPLRSPTPFSETISGVTANFSSPTDFPPTDKSFSVQNSTTAGSVVQSLFSGQFVYPNRVNRDQLDIVFSQAIDSISLVFATIDYNDPANDAGSFLQLSAFLNGAAVGSATVQGAFTVGNTYPQGTLAFNSAQGFNQVHLIVPFIPQGATSLMVDSITVNTLATGGGGGTGGGGSTGGGGGTGGGGSAAPEPATIGMLGLGLGLAFRSRRRS